MPNVPNADESMVQAVGDAARKRVYDIIAKRTDYKPRWHNELLDLVCEDARQAYLQGYSDAGLAAISALANSPPEE